MNLGMEDEYTEHKRSTSELREGMESVASILNKHGHGTLYFGVRPSDGEVIGQDVSEKTLRDVSQAFTNRIEPRVYPTIKCLLTEEGKAYIRATFSGDERPYACDGRYRIRSADEDLPMSTSMLEQMMLEHASLKSPWDRCPSGKTVADVNENTLRAYVERGVKRDRIPHGFTDAKDVLARLGLLCEDGVLTNAAAVCFTRSRNVALRMGVFADRERIDILDNHQERGDLFELVDSAELYILNNTRRAFIIDDSSLHRDERPEIPKRAIREALFNAFCHRRYEDDAAVQVDVFWDSVDIYSPGSFPSLYTPEDYLAKRATASKPRNHLIAQTLYRSGDIETFGTGLRRIKRACDEEGVPVEVFQLGGFVHVRFTRFEGVAAGGSATGSPISARKVREKCANNLGKTDSEILAFVAEAGTVSNSDVAECMGMSISGTRKALQRLIDEGLVTRYGQGKRTRYKLSEEAADN